jgi:hypothetical protein
MVFVCYNGVIDSGARQGGRYDYDDTAGAGGEEVF